MPYRVNLFRRWRVVFVLIMVPMAVLLALRLKPGLDVRGFSALGHLIVVSGIALCALAAASAAMVTAVRSRQPGVIWLGLGCVAVGGASTCTTMKSLAASAPSLTVNDTRYAAAFV